MKLFNYFILIISGMAFMACNMDNRNSGNDDFKYIAEQFADLKILRYQIPGFEELDLNTKTQLYYLYEAALSGREIIIDQNNKHNLYVKRSLEAIVSTYSGDKNSAEFKKFMTYVKRIWFSNGIHHHYASKKFEPEFSQNYFGELLDNSDSEKFPVQDDETFDDLKAKLMDIIFNPETAPLRINLSPNQDLVKTSSNNYYEGLTQKEVEQYFKSIIDPDDPRPVSYGLNSKLIKTNGKIEERVWKVGGMYTEAIEKMVYWLNKAIIVTDDAQQKRTLELLVEYLETGDLRKWDEYNIAWVQDTLAVTDVVNGFIEVYGDPLGYKAAFEGIVSFKDMKATKRIKAIGDQAQWFEDNSPLMDEHKKKDVKGISAKVITVVVESGDASPSTPIGINLPNANWIRADHGSKSVNLGNIVHSYNMSAGGKLEEFAYSQEEIDRGKKHGALADDLHTDMHEVIGHASGVLNPGVGTPKETLKNYASTLEEARADLVALYYQYDKKLVEIGVMESLEVGKAGYEDYIRNGLMTQLSRLEPGANLEQAHMRNRQIVASWVYKEGMSDNVIEKITRDGKTYFVINDYNKLKELFGVLLREIQRIKSEGDFEAGKELVETYGVKVDQDLHREVLERYSKLNIAPYSGFINPKLIPVLEGEKIVDVRVEYPDDFTEQMMYYAEKYSFLPEYN
jgi:dipeptidyl-peptidase-3